MTASVPFSPIMSNSLQPHGLTVACQGPLSMELPRQEYCRGWPFPSPGDHPNSETEPTSLMDFALTGEFFTTSVT